MISPNYPGGTPRKTGGGGGVRPASWIPYPIYDQNLRYSLPIYDLTRNSKPNLWPDPHIKILFQARILISSVVQTDQFQITVNIICEGLFVDFLFDNHEKVAYIHIKARVQKPYPIYDQNQLNLIPYPWPKLLKNHTLWGRTYLYSPCKRVPPPLGGNPETLFPALVENTNFFNISFTMICECNRDKYKANGLMSLHKEKRINLNWGKLIFYIASISHDQIKYLAGGPAMIWRRTTHVECGWSE